MENNVMDTNVIDTEFVEDEMNTGRTGKGLVKAVIVGSLVVGGVTLFLKTKKKREQRKIEKLRKQGYVIYEPSADTVDETNVETTKED